MKSIEYIDYLIEMEYKPMCSTCGKELRFKGAIFYKGKVYCMDCRRKLKHMKESDFDNYNYRHLVSEINVVEERIKELQSKRCQPNSKVIKSRGKDITVYDRNERNRKEEIEHLKDKLNNLNSDLDKLNKN